MGIDIYTKDEGETWRSFILLCNTTDKPFGNKFHGTLEEAEGFIQWLPIDPRSYEDDEELADLFMTYQKHFHTTTKVKK